MACRIDPSFIAGPLAALAVLAPDTAEACPNYVDPKCDDSETWYDIQLDQSRIPVDGVLVLSGVYNGDDGEHALSLVDVVVTRDGQPIAGALEPTPTPEVLVWRPAAAWQVGDGYTVDFDVLSEPGAECGVIGPNSAVFTVDGEPGVTASALEFTMEDSFHDALDVTLAGLACCEDAPSPVVHHENYLGCYSYSIEFDAEACTPTTSTGSLVITASGEVPPEVAVVPQHLYTLVHDDQAVAVALRDTNRPYLARSGFQGPACVRVDITDLASGAVVRGEERCFGDEHVGQYGTRPLAELLPTACPGALEQCAIVDDTWDRTMCEPFDAPEPATVTEGEAGSESGSGSDSDSDPGADPEVDAGCGCSANGAGSSAGLLGLALLGVRRRRSGG